MKNQFSSKKIWPTIAGILVGILGFVFTLQIASAAAPGETEDPPAAMDSNGDCKTCHIDVADHWSTSPHAHAYDDPVFQESWNALEQPGECLACHTTNYKASTGTFDAEGIDCEACHGKVGSEHPPAPVEIKADTEYCGICHTTTLGEWRQTGHATAEIGCTSCHDPHSQQSLFEVADEMCINCHQDSMGDYLEDNHIIQGIGCVDCHALVIPPDPIPEDGIVPTGHAFTITPATCVACHTDSLHAGFHLPGYEHGAKNGNGDTETEISFEKFITDTAEEDQLSSQQMQALEAAVASRNVTMIFQGGLVGLVLGGSTAWFMAANSRFAQRDMGDVDEEDDEEQDA